MLKILATAAVVSATAFAATPASAVITTFASYNAMGSGNFVFSNNGTGGSNATNRSNGTGGSLYTTPTAASVRPSATTPGSINTTFSFLLPQLTPYVNNVAATFTFLASVTHSPVVSAAGFDIEPGLSGSFSFLSKAPIVIGGHTFATGSNLLSGTFNDLAIYGFNQSTSGTAGAATTAGATITYTSDFLSFVPTVDRDFSFSLSAIQSFVNSQNKGLNFVNGKALRSFRGTATGSFSTDPAPLVTAIPEPQVWGLLVAGFGLVGFQARRRRIVLAA